MTDVIADLVHDHAELNARVLALAARLRADQDGGAYEDEVWKALVELRDHLFLHFAREEEGLFPFIAEIAPDLSSQVVQLQTAHDTICGVLARLCHLADSDARPATIQALFERFQAVYADHASAEALFLRSLNRRLDDTQRERLAAIVAGI